MSQEPLPGRPARVVRTVAVNLVLAALLVEAISLVWFWAGTRQLYYLRDPQAATTDLPTELARLEQRLGTTVVERLHPLFGFVNLPFEDHRPGFPHNRRGFLSPYEYPFMRRSDRQLLVGVFGGSVAANYALFEIERGRLAERLRHQPGLEEVEPVFLSFALGGYKQPQQLLLLNYFLSIGQELDLVINIDGFNEAALSHLNKRQGVDPVLPSVLHVGPLVTLGDARLAPEALEPIVEMMRAKEALIRARERQRGARFATVHLIASRQAGRQVRRIERLATELESATSRLEHDPEASAFHYFGSLDGELPDEPYSATIADHWAESSLLMHELLAARGIPYVHVLQPNQYHPTGREYTRGERRRVLRRGSPFRVGVRLAYPAMRQRIPILEGRGVGAFDGTRILDRIPGAVYIDTCCHYTVAGEEALSAFVAEAVAQVLTEAGR